MVLTGNTRADKGYSVAKAENKGSLLVVSAPSGAGKTSLCKGLLESFPGLRLSISYTTRPARTGETDGVDYFFVTRDEFKKMVANGAFAEWAVVHGNCYGTAKDTLDSARQRGANILLDIDCQGAAQLKENYGEGVFIFILPPSLEELKKRLLGRKTDAPEVINTRIENARREIAEASWYDYIIVNDDFSVALEELKAIKLSEDCRSFRRCSFLKRFVDKEIDGKSPLEDNK
ncbi:MAG: guanylate kinase [Deltaproteobacteria bacterium]|nr:guanylate kinase [Deltaproteobacteria bacterium]